MKAFTHFRGRLEELRAHDIRAVATSAVREAGNRWNLVDRISKEAGVHLEVISGSEEARLVHLAVSSQIDLRGGKWVLVDLGGGSVEVSLVDDAGIIWSESHTMGSVRLLEELAGASGEPGSFQRLLQDYVSVLRIPNAAQYWEPAGFIATGGNIESLAMLAAGTPNEKGVAKLSVRNLESAIELLSRFSYRDRVEELGLRKDRADVILPAALVYLRLAKLTDVEEILVPGTGVKEGILLDMVDGIISNEGHEERQERQIAQAAVSLGRRYMFNEAHGRQVARLAVSIFDQLTDLHGLEHSERRLLRAAGILHDMGQFISFKKHHKHALYLISRSELPGLSEREMLIAANVARYHRKNHPLRRHGDFMALEEEDRRRVTYLSAILRIADALDRQHVQCVEEVRASATESELHLELHGRGDLLLERWAVSKKAGLFEETFGLRVVIDLE